MDRDILEGYTQEEIEELAREQLRHGTSDDNLPLQIIKIDKEYKKHNKQAVSKAIKNGVTILICAGVVLNSNSNLANFGTEELSNIFNNIIQYASYLPLSDFPIAVYTKLFEGINQVISSIGLIGILLATKSIKFLLTTLKDGKKSLELKQDLKVLEEKYNAIKQNEEQHVK